MTERKRNREHYFNALPIAEAKFGIIRASLRGEFFEFLTATSVFSKRRIDLGTRLLIESLVLPDAGVILDIGCGYGPVGIAVAAFNSELRVIMTDVNMRAVRLARKNIITNKLVNAEVRHGYLYESVEDLVFDCVLSNPPVSAGMETVKAIIKGALKVMANKATFQMVIRSKIGKKTITSILEDTFGNYSVLARKSGYRVFLAGKR